VPSQDEALDQSGYRTSDQVAIYSDEIGQMQTTDPVVFILLRFECAFVHPSAFIL